MTEPIFINYRREDARAEAHLLYAQLATTFSSDLVFLDVAGEIPPGADFPDAIQRKVKTCDVLVAVIGPSWLELLRSRDGSTDYVIEEIATALRLDKRVIPVLVDGAPLPSEDQLPQELRALLVKEAYRSAGQDYRRLVEELGQHIGLRLWRRRLKTAFGYAFTMLLGLAVGWSGWARDLGGRISESTRENHVEKEPDVQKPAWAARMSKGNKGSELEGARALLKVGDIEVYFRRIPPGQFTMGSPKTEAGRWGDEDPLHEVRLRRGFWLAETETTQGLWQAVMDGNPSWFRGDPDKPFERNILPVETVSYSQVQEFIAKLNKIAPLLPARLPTEAEWEFACLGGQTTSTFRGELLIVGENYGRTYQRFSDGSERIYPLGEIAIYGGSSGIYDPQGHRPELVDASFWMKREPYGSDKPPKGAGTYAVNHITVKNDFGLQDMLGNVWEWTRDQKRRYPEGAGVLVDPSNMGSGNDKRIVRGGAFDSRAQEIRCAGRHWANPDTQHKTLGFRIAVD